MEFFLVLAIPSILLCAVFLFFYLRSLEEDDETQQYYETDTKEPVLTGWHLDFAESTAAPGLTQQERAERMSRAVVKINMIVDGNSVTFGSGFVVDNRLGLVVTNEHVINRKGGIQITYISGYLPNGEAVMKTTNAKIVGVPSKEEDLALLQMEECPDLPWVDWTCDIQPHYGMNALIVGHPQGYSWSHAYGKITHPKRFIAGYCSTGFPLVQTDALCSAGSSGGALFDENGNLLGVMKATSKHESTIAFARPTAALENYINHLRDTGEMAPRRTALKQIIGSPEGTYFASQEGDFLDATNFTDGALQTGDIVVAVDGVQPLSANHYLQLMWASTSGVVSLAAVRGNEIVQVEANILQK